MSEPGKAVDKRTPTNKKRLVVGTAAAAVAVAIGSIIYHKISDSPQELRFNVPTYDGGRALIPKVFRGRVSHVPDADDVVVTTANTLRFKVRLAEIDCPEWDGGQPFHEEAKQITTELAFGKDVAVEHRQTNEGYNRIVGWVTLPDGTDLSRELIRRGAAWHYEEYSDHPQELDELQREARNARRGLWAAPNPIYPERWRRGFR